MQPLIYSTFFSNLLFFFSIKLSYFVTVPPLLHQTMESVVNAATTAFIRSLIHAIRAGAFEAEIHRLELDLLQIRLSRQVEAFSTINNTEALQHTSQIPQEQQRPLAEILAQVQHILSHAQQDAIKIRANVAKGATVGGSLLAFLDKCRAQKARAISRMQWAVYRRHRCERNLAAITALVDEVERLASDLELGTQGPGIIRKTETEEILNTQGHKVAFIHTDC